MNTICAEELGASVNFARRGTFSQDCGQGRKLAWAAWLNFQLCLDFLSVPLLNFFVLCSRAEVLLLWVLGLFFCFFSCMGFLLDFRMHTKWGNKSASFAAVYCSTTVNMECLGCFEKLLPKI